MEEVLNQELTSEVTTDDVFSDKAGEDLFADSIDTPVKEEGNEDKPKVDTNNAEDNAKEKNANANTVETKPFLKVQYNKEEKELNEEEARTLAQKGMNYDKINDKYNALESELKKLADVNGLSVEDYLVKLGEVQKNVEVENEFAKLKEKYPDTNEEVLKELANRTVENNANSKVQSQLKIEKEQSDAREAEVDRQIKEFASAFPDVNPDTLPDEVVKMALEGKTLLAAYITWSKANEAKESAEKIAKLNEENKKKSLGNTTNAGNDEPDDFFSGFDSI